MLITDGNSMKRYFPTGSAVPTAVSEASSVDHTQNPVTRFQRRFIKYTKRRTLCNLSLRDSAIQRCTLSFHCLQQRALEESKNLFLLV